MFLSTNRNIHSQVFALKLETTSNCSLGSSCPPGLVWLRTGYRILGGSSRRDQALRTSQPCSWAARPSNPPEIFKYFDSRADLELAV